MYIPELLNALIVLKPDREIERHTMTIAYHLDVHSNNMGTMKVNLCSSSKRPNRISSLVCMLR